MKTVLTLVRHGQTEDNAEGRWQGRRDGPLTAEGRQQVAALAQRLRRRGRFSAVYASPLRRAVETARLLASSLGDVPMKTDARLIEYDFGAWDGLTATELRAHRFWDAVERDPEFTPPQGEPFGAAARRVVAALRELAASHGGARVAVVGHGLALAAALALLIDGDPRRAPRYTLDNGGTAALALDRCATLIDIDPVMSCDLA